METKICKNCNIKKNIDMFADNKRGLMGKQSQCKECLAKKAREKYQVNRDSEVERSKKWNKNNASKVAENMRKYRVLKKEQYLKNRKEWQLKNPDKVKIYNARKHAKRRCSIEKTEFKLTEIEWNNIIINQKYKCFYCLKKMKKPTIDHVIPLAKGGSHSKENIVASCLTCNCSKGKKDISEFAKFKGMLIL